MSRWLPIVLLLGSLTATGAEAQLSGSSFGGSRGFGGGSSSSSSSFGGGSSFGSSSSGSNSSYLERQRQRREAERARQEAERERRRAEEAARRAREEEERRRREAERQRQERQLAADRALPPAERAALQRRFGDRIRRPEPPGPVADVVHAPEPSPDGDAPDVRDVRLPQVYDRPMRTVPNWSEGAPAGLFAGTVFVLLLFGIVATRRRRAELVGLRADAGGIPRGRPRRASGGSCEIRRISLAFDWTERARIQQALERMAGKYDMGSASGMHGAASEAAQLLVGALPSARYGMFQRYLESQSRAERRFFDLAQDLKSRFRHDTRRGGRRDFEAKAEEGQGLVVVSFVVGATRHLGPMSASLDRGAIARLLQAAVRISPRELVALEVVWSPSAENDRMSSLELETVYPELVPLDSGSLGGISCGYCGAIHAAELPKCPACGASR